MVSYNSETTAEQVAEDCRSQIANKTIFVTGASPGGLGAAFATTIAQFGPACFILATRELAKAEETAKEITAIAPSVRTHCIQLDLASLAQVREAAGHINTLDKQIDVIVNNAGIMACPYSKTVDGIERQFATNYLGHFLLTNLILPKILARNEPVRVVNVSSDGYRYSPIRFEDVNFDDGENYNRWIAYGQSKTGSVLFSASLARKLGKRNLVTSSLHPGIIWTKLARDLGMEDFGELGPIDRAQGHRSHWARDPTYKSTSQGVATHAFAAFHPSLDSAELNGSYLEDCCVMDPKDVYCWGRDPVDAEKLWKLSEELVGQTFTY